MSDKQFALQLQNINKDYRQGRSTIEVLKNINLEIDKNQSYRTFMLFFLDEKNYL